MKATDILIEEHHIILKALDCMEKILEEAEGCGKLNLHSASQWIEFIRHFADHCHHGKEEKKLFPMMEESGVPREGGPIGCMLSEHEFGRNCIRQMNVVLEPASKGNTQALKQFIHSADEFILMLRGHITKENNVLFKIADQFLDSQQKEQLFQEFKKVDQEFGKCHSKYFGVVQKLCEDYQVPFMNANQFHEILV